MGTRGLLAVWGALDACAALLSTSRSEEAMSNVGCAREVYELASGAPKVIVRREAKPSHVGKQKGKGRGDVRFLVFVWGMFCWLSLQA